MSLIRNQWNSIKMLEFKVFIFISKSDTVTHVTIVTRVTRYSRCHFDGLCNLPLKSMLNFCDYFLIYYEGYKENLKWHKDKEIH